jgi:hypothetical protein
MSNGFRKITCRKCNEATRMSKGGFVICVSCNQYQGNCACNKVNVPEKKWYMRTQKAFIGDVFVALLIFLLIPSVLVVAFFTASTQVQSLLQGMANNGILTQTAVNTANQMHNLYYLFDIIIPFWVVGSMVAIFIYAAFLNSSRLVLAIGFIIMIILTFICFYISNAWYGILTNPILINAAASFPNTIFLVDELPIICAIGTIVYLLIAVTKLRSGNTGGFTGSPGGGMPPTAW